MNRESGGRRIIELDNRRRANLARIADPQHRYYAVDVETDGVITLTPVEVVPAVVGVKPATLEPAEAVERLRGSLERLSVEYDGGVIRRHIVEPPQAHEGGDW